MASEFEIIAPRIRNLLDIEVEESKLNFSKVGDIFNSSVYLGTGTIYRTWHFDIPSPNLGRRELYAKIGLRFNPIQSVVVLIINGEAKVKYPTDFENNVMKILFKLYDVEFETTITVKFPKLFYHIDMKFNNADVKDIRNQITSTNSLQTNVHPKHVTIPSLRTCSVNKSPFVVYQIFCELSSTEKVMVERRFSDFDKLDKVLHGIFSGSHLKDTFPSLPSKVYNPFVKQTEFSFLTARKGKLEEYLNFLLTNEKVCTLATPFSIILISVLGISNNRSIVLPRNPSHYPSSFGSVTSG